MKKYWIKEEETYLRDNYKQKSNKTIGEYLGRSRNSIKAKCENMKLIRTPEDTSNIISNGMRTFFKKTNKIWERVNRGGDLYDKRRRRNELLKNLGGKCVLCNITDPDVLQFDHINNDGYKYPNISTITQVEQHPEKLQILCANCNTKKEMFRREFDRLEKLGIPPF